MHFLNVRCTFTLTHVLPYVAFIYVIFVTYTGSGGKCNQSLYLKGNSTIFTPQDLFTGPGECKYCICERHQPAGKGRQLIWFTWAFQAIKAAYFSSYSWHPPYSLFFWFALSTLPQHLCHTSTYCWFPQWPFVFTILINYICFKYFCGVDSLLLTFLEPVYKVI